MNRYLLFSGDHYYPLGGTRDLKKSSEKVEDLIPFIDEMRDFQWAYIMELNVSFSD